MKIDDGKRTLTVAEASQSGAGTPAQILVGVLFFSLFNYSARRTDHSSNTYVSCPIRLSLGSLGRKWALLILRDIAFLHDLTFSEILHRNTGLTPRALSLRLRDLQEEGVIERVVDRDDNRKIHYRLTKQGRDVVPILTA